MRAFIDTSALLKKYIRENGSEEFEDILLSVDDIIVSPTYALEARAAIARRVRLKDIEVDQGIQIRKEINKDIIHFEQVVYNDNLNNKAIDLIDNHVISTLDSIQLASACLSRADIFVTADKDLYIYAKQELKNVRYI